MSIAELEDSDLSGSLPSSFAGTTTVGSIINLTPHGTVFNSCVTIEVPYTYTNSYLAGTLLKAADTDSDFELVSDATYVDNDDGTGTAAACLSSFSTLQVVESLNPSLLHCPQGLPSITSSSSSSSFPPPLPLHLHLLTSTSRPSPPPLMCFQFRKRDEVCGPPCRFACLPAYQRR